MVISTFHFLLVLIPSSLGEPAECNNYKTLKEANRAITNPKTENKCDAYLKPGWYRITGEAGDHIPEKCVPKRHCGTNATGWLNGKHPTIREGLVTRQVCFHWGGKCCRWNIYIKIRNCGEYYVYQLYSTKYCYLRYCGEKSDNIKLTCNGELSFYDRHNDMLFISNNTTNISSNYNLNQETQVLAVKCINYQSQPWIMGSVSNGLITDSRWKCISPLDNDMVDSLTWATDLFDDSNWAQAVANFSNGGESPWGIVPDISDDALWISTADKSNSRLFCRRRLSEVSLKRTKSKGIFQATLDDVDHALSSHPRSEHEVSDVMQCFEKCREVSQCLSFNFEYSSVLPTKKCELNGVTKGQDPKNYVKRPGYTYYDNAG